MSKHKECYQDGHVVYENKEHRQEEVTAKCLSGENWLNYLLARRKRYTLGGIEAMMHTLRMKRIQILKQKGWYETNE